MLRAGAVELLSQTPAAALAGTHTKLEDLWSRADLAAAEGYCDQAHLTREFQAVAGVTPGRYRRIRPVYPRHIPI